MNHDGVLSFEEFLRVGEAALLSGAAPASETTPLLPLSKKSRARAVSFDAAELAVAQAALSTVRSGLWVPGGACLDVSSVSVFVCLCVVLQSSPPEVSSLIVSAEPSLTLTRHGPSDVVLPRIRGGLFHAAMANPHDSTQREAALRSLFAALDTNSNGSLDVSEVRQFMQWAATANEAEEVHRRLALCFLEGGSLEASFAK